MSRAFIDATHFSSEVYWLFENARSRGDSISNRMGEAHRAMRGPIQPMFSPEAAQDWWHEKSVAETVDVLVSGIEGKGRCNIFLELCARMPVHVISAGFGFAPDEILPFRVALLDSVSHAASRQQQQAAEQTTKDMLTRLIEARRRSPRDDVVSRLVQAEVAEPDGSVRPFTNDEIIANCRLIVQAGGGTTWRQLGIVLFALLNHPDQFDLFKADRSLFPRVILEVARWYPTDLIFPRLVIKDTTLGGVDIPEGSLLHMCIGSANRDPTRWENPDVFDITRPVQRSVTFGAGAHSCLGQHVSRQEMEVALNAIMDRLPNLRWDPAEPPARLVGGLFQRGPSALHVLYD